MREKELVLPVTEFLWFFKRSEGINFVVIMDTGSRETVNRTRAGQKLNVRCPPCWGPRD